MTSYCEAPTLPHLNYPSHDFARSLGQLLPMPMTGSEYKSETPEQVLATGKLSHLRQTIQTVAIFQVYSEERWEVFFLRPVDDHQIRIFQHRPLHALLPCLLTPVNSPWSFLWIHLPLTVLLRFKLCQELFPGHSKPLLENCGLWMSRVVSKKSFYSL